MTVFFFVQKICINSAATVFQNIFISFDSGRKLKSTLFECALHKLPNGIGLLFLPVLSKNSFSLHFCEFVKFSLSLLELMQLQCFQVLLLSFCERSQKSKVLCLVVWQ